MINSSNIFKTVICNLFTTLSFAIFIIIAFEANCIAGERLENSINLSGEYIVSSTNPDGKFDYLVNPATNEVSQSEYNILRHSGAIYSLGQLYMLNRDKKVLDAMILSSNYLKNCCIMPIKGNNDVLAVWSLPQINRSINFKKVKLGGTGLGLVALAGLKKIKSETTNIEYLRKLGNSILYMQKDDGSFYSRYSPMTGGLDDSWTSLYYPGEAALGLAMLYEVDPQQKWFDASVKVLTYLANSRKTGGKVPADHWALIATGKVIELAEKNSLKIPKQLLIDHGKQVSEVILKNIAAIPKSSPIFGCLSRDGRTTPTATRLEGLIAFYNVLPEDDEELMKKFKPVMSNGVDFLQRMQIKDGRYRGGMPQAYSKTGNNKADFIRIDYVQHALSAMVEYYNTFKVN